MQKAQRETERQRHRKAGIYLSEMQALKAESARLLIHLLTLSLLPLSFFLLPLSFSLISRCRSAPPPSPLSLSSLSHSLPFIPPSLFLLPSPLSLLPLCFSPLSLSHSFNSSIQTDEAEMERD